MSSEEGSLLELVAGSMPAALWTTDADLLLVSHEGLAADAFVEEGEGGGKASLRMFLAGAHRRALAGECVAFDVERNGRHLRAFVRPRRADGGNVDGVSGFAFDRTDEIAAVASLQRSEKTLALVQSAAHLGSWTHDLVTGAFAWSDELFALCGRIDRTSPPTPALLWRYVHVDDRLALEAAIELAREQRRSYAIDTRLLADDGVERWVQHRGRYEFDAFGPVLVTGTVQDVTGRKRAQENLGYRANYDELTGLPNRKLLGDRLQQALLQDQHNDAQLAVLCVDLDRFKSINDTLGHDVGDEFLRLVAPRLVAAVRDTDTIARSGSDEFIIVLPDITSVGEAARIAERVVAAFALPASIGGRDLYSSASVGISVFPDDGRSPDHLIRGAEAALYLAKEAGHGTFRFYAASTHARAVTRLELEHALRRAYEREEFVLHYQPLVDRYERPVAVEALLRWTDSALGVVGPDTFIPLCEEIGLIVPLGRWVIRSALKQLALWNDVGFGYLRMALNISARQFLDPELTATMREIIAETGVSPERVELEITESVVMGDVLGARSVISEMRALGFRISLDDFGTGYSSLSYLKHFSVDALKIDRTFVRDLPQDRGDLAIVSAVVALGHAMGLRVVAEGVETAEQAAQVSRLGCDEMQGFYFAKPMPPVALERVLRSWRGVGNVS
ncbi:MAG: EAL domain-containing protein [Candidatus Eremiobacteraeota bacterium]|nr:EAL domain-containing protein [Candidatus Eremiobacteraeota bacterium]